jgi:hypothetical protein
MNDLPPFRKVLVPRLERAAMVLLEVADGEVAAAIAAVLLAADSQDAEAPERTR